MAVFSAKQNSAAKATFLCNFLFLPEKESWRKITTFAPAMDRSRTYNPATSRRAFPSPPAQAHVPAGWAQKRGSNQKPIANGQRPIAKIQHPTTNPQFPTSRWTHTFSAKEKDSETGLSYFGARYYSSELSIWLSVDPQASKYPSLSPYVYCADNPIKLVDPNGEEINPIYDLEGNFITNTKEGFTGEVLIYSGGRNDIDFSNMTKEDVMIYSGMDTYDNQRPNLSNEAKSKIWTHIVSQYEGLRVYDEVFSMSSIKDEKIGYGGSGNWNTDLKTNSICGTDRYSYESTVENIASSIIVHEWYSHRMKKNGNKMKSHRLAYKNVINYKYFWNKTTNNYKGFNVRELYEYTKQETGRTNVDSPYRYSYKKYHLCK